MHPDLRAILAEGEALLDGFDHTRDRLRALDPDAVPDLLTAAEDPARGDVRGVLWYALADWAYPPALARMVELVDDPLDDVVIASAFALDTLSGGQFDVSNRFVPGGWPDYDAMRTELGPEVRAWWAREGRAALPTVEAWRAGVTERELPSKDAVDLALVSWVHDNKIALTGRKRPVTDRAEVLPRDEGVHLVPATVSDGGERVRAVLMVDSDEGAVMVALVPDPGAPAGWRPIPADDAVPDFATDGVALPTG